MSILKSNTENKPEEKKSGLKSLEDDDLDQVAGGSGEPDGYKGSTGYETAGFLLP